MFKNAAIFLTCMMIAFSAQAANFIAKVNRNPVPLGETFVLTLQYDGNPGNSEPDLSPLHKDFTIYSVGRDYQHRSINGVVSNTYQWNVVMAPKVADRAIIPAIMFKDLSSRPIELKIAAETVAGSNTPKFSIGRSITKHNPFVQEQLIYTLVLKTTEEVRGNMPQFPENANTDWVIKQIDNPVVSSEIDNGIETRKIEIRYAMFPQKSGKLQTPELTFNGYYIDKNKLDNRYFSSVFGGFASDVFGRMGMDQSMQRINLTAKPIEVDVRPIPAINNGDWWLPSTKVEINSDWQDKIPAFKAGEAVNRKITLMAAGVADTQLPKLRFKEQSGLKQYPEKPEYASIAVDNGIISSMTINVVYIPEHGGQMTLPEIVVPWYNITTNQMEKAILPAVKIMVDGKPASETITDNFATTPEKAENKDITTSESKNYLSLKFILSIVALAFAAGLGVSWLILRYNNLSSAQISAKTSKDDLQPSSKHNLKKALQDGNLKNIRNEILLWARQIYPDETIRNLEDVAHVLDSEELGKQFRQLDSALYSDQSGKVDIPQLSKLMTNLMKKQKAKKSDSPLLPRLYK